MEVLSQKEMEAGPTIRMQAGPNQSRMHDGGWLTEWLVENLGRHPVQLLTARLPHPRFRSDEVNLSQTPRILPGEKVRIYVPAQCDASGGSVAENAFLILRFLCDQKLWRVFAKMYVVFSTEAAPQVHMEEVKTEPAGYSG
jgi:hypothetical protein